jgi:hypothetical protein
MEGGLMIETQARATVTVNAMQWTTLDHIADVRPIGDEDAECLEDIRQVLMKHGALDRFGISLLHRHFDVADDELMLETTDEDAREHWVRPIKKAVFEAEGVTAQSTIVAFDETGYRQHCGCDPRTSGHHHK